MDRRTMKETIEASAKVLIGMPLWNMGRSASIVWFDFGSNLTSVPTRRGGTTLVGEYVIDTESAWHLGGPDGIIVASDDRAYPAGEDPYKDLPEFEWDKEGVINRCDERMKNFLDEHKDSPLIVEAISANHWGGLTISLSAGYILEIFPDVSIDSMEYWRLFQPANDKAKHFVVTAQGIK